jgi:hypothetical protein
MEEFEDNKVEFPSPKAVLIVAAGYLIFQLLTWWVEGIAP